MLGHLFTELDSGGSFWNRYGHDDWDEDIGRGLRCQDCHDYCYGHCRREWVSPDLPQSPNLD